MMSESPQIYLWAFVFLSNRINDMLIVLLSLFSGINFALAILSFFIVSKNRSQKIYLYFGIFSLFSGLYFLFIAISETTGTNQIWIVLLCAAIYYGVFPFFLFELIGAKHKVVSWLTSSIFLIAFIVFFTEPVSSDFSIWQIIAHTGLLSLGVIASYVSIVLLREKENGAFAFSVLTAIFLLLAIEEMFSSYTGIKIISQYTGDFLPLDIYPLLFTLVISRQLSNEVYNRNQLKIRLIKSELGQKELEIEKLEKQELQNELFHKTKDLTEFGVEIARRKEFTQFALHKLVEIKKASNINSDELNELINYTKAQRQIDKDLELFHKNTDKVNHKFNSTLKNSFPALTDNEIHLASLLRLKLTTKEIASIKNITPDSVKVLRYRLRKKLELTTSKSLSGFLINFE